MSVLLSVVTFLPESSCWVRRFFWSTLSSTVIALGINMLWTCPNQSFRGLGLPPVAVLYWGLLLLEADNFPKPWAYELSWIDFIMFSFQDLTLIVFCCLLCVCVCVVFIVCTYLCEIKHLYFSVFRSAFSVLNIFRVKCCGNAGDEKIKEGITYRKLLIKHAVSIRRARCSPQAAENMCQQWLVMLYPWNE